MGRYSNKYRKHKNYSKRRKRRYRRKRRSEPDWFLLAVGALIIVGLVTTYGATIQKITFGALPAIISIGGVLVVGAIFLAVVRRVKEKRIRNRYYEAQRTLPHLRHMDPFEFEQFVGWVFERYGYRAITTQKGGDHGIDVVLKKKGEVYAVQVKRYTQGNTIGEPTLRDFYGSFIGEGIKKGFFVTTSDYTTAAKGWAQDRPLVLINGEQFVDMLDGSADVLEAWYTTKESLS